MQVTMLRAWCQESFPEMTYNVFSGTLNPTHFAKRAISNKLYRL